MTYHYDPILRRTVLPDGISLSNEARAEIAALDLARVSQDGIASAFGVDQVFLDYYEGLRQSMREYDQEKSQRYVSPFSPEWQRPQWAVVDPEYDRVYEYDFSTPIAVIHWDKKEPNIGRAGRSILEEMSKGNGLSKFVDCSMRTFEDITQKEIAP